MHLNIPICNTERQAADTIRAQVDELDHSLALYPTVVSGQATFSFYRGSQKYYSYRIWFISYLHLYNQSKNILFISQWLNFSEIDSIFFLKIYFDIRTYIAQYNSKFQIRRISGYRDFDKAWKNILNFFNEFYLLLIKPIIIFIKNNDLKSF